MDYAIGLIMKDNNVQSVLNKQRLDKFRLVLSIPNILKDMNTTDWSVMEQDLVNQDTLQFSLYTANIPDISIPSKALPTMGQTVKVTSQVRAEYPPVTCKFVVDNRFKNYWVIWKRLETINNVRESGMNPEFAMNNPVDVNGQLHQKTDFWGYQTIISIFPLDEYNNDMCEFKFHNAFITKLGGLGFNYQDPSQADGEFTFEFGQMEVLLVDE